MSWVIVGWVEERNPTNQPDIYKCDREVLPKGDRIALPAGDREVLPKGDRIALPTGSHITPPMGDREAIQETAHSQLYTENNPVLNFYESKTKKIRSRILLS
ncbi:hypothetical protein, partial [Cylindrospermopsis raciborskii]|uniref:hypothetical protein n=1 Tax=Cylindrospermopsis raciborskii TaxID=77022 RepID=UPI0011AF9352